MFGVPSAALALALSLGLAPETDDTTAQALSTEQCESASLDFFYGLGPADAPTLLRVYLDPTAFDQNPLRIWLEIRRIVGERHGELRVELLTTRGGLTQADPESDAVRLWFMAVTALGRAEEALRVLDRDDPERVAAELRSEEGRARLAREVELDPSAIEDRQTGGPGSCLRRSLDRASNHLAAQSMGQRMMLVGVVDREGREQFQYIDAELSELRTQIDHLITAPGYIDEVVHYIPYMPALNGRASRYDRTFPATGVLVGGDALPHRLVIFVEDEDHGRLPDWLDPAMRYRGQHPGRLSVQVIAAGVGSRAIGFRRRLCAARSLGVEVEYLLYLADRPAVRRLHEAEIDELLQPVADSDTCSDTEALESRPGEVEDRSRRGDFGHPRGAYLDGRPVNPSDIDGLEWQLDAEAAPSIIDWLLTPDASVLDGGSGGPGEFIPFEF